MVSTNSAVVGRGRTEVSLDKLRANGRSAAWTARHRIMAREKRRCELMFSNKCAGGVALAPPVLRTSIVHLNRVWHYNLCGFDVVVEQAGGG